MTSALIGELGHVSRQRPIGAEQAERMLFQLQPPGVILLIGSNVRRREHQVWLLAEPYRVVSRFAGFAQAGPLRKGLLEQAQSREKTEPLRRAAQLLEWRQTSDRRP